MGIKEVVKENMNLLINLRKKLNLNGELAFQEYKTKAIILDFLNKLQLDAKIFAKTGVAATLNSGDDCIAIRADIDALPVNGISHACGHDYHTAILLGTALVLKELKINKTVKFIFQPAEEASGGAETMIAEGVLENPKVKSILGFHVWPNLHVGKIEVSSGPSMASVDDFYITFKGKGGHAAMPHLSKNPLYPAIDFIQTINVKSQIESNPLNSHVITFTSIQCGNAPNIIVDDCKICGTVRTFDNNLRKKIHEDFLENSYICAKKYDCSAEVDYKFQYPPLVSHPDLTDAFIKTAKKLVGEHNVLPLERTFAAEDFAFFAEKVPAVHFRLGISDGVKGTHPLHSCDFDASDEAIFHGICTLVNFITTVKRM
ncbi:M20 family metallopeptidase [Clostridium sp. CX1]|uniref:M20 metallopeptidase family protein n=1 Tax=Clostridium sp. CX1 TaxID=2978346 RepID=UPI0021C1D420|nr:M20 family metallopeptidase [Clostridium sp. CX1]MCT8976586.1 M20 family metallopeptidase [Clostridium sp. CX1]